MKNTLRIVLIILGVGLIGLSLYMLFFPDASLGRDIVNDKKQAYAMLVFGVLSFLSGIAYTRK